MDQDKTLIGNKLIENALIKMYKNLNDKNLADVLTVIRKRMNDGGHFVVAVKYGTENSMELRPVSTPDGKRWFAAFTSFDEELKKSDPVVSGFTAEISKLFDIALGSDEITGIIINPWDKALKLDKNTIKLIKGQAAGS